LIATAPDSIPHTHGPGGAHVHAATTAFTTWLDLSLARAQAEAVRAAMASRWPELTHALNARHSRLDATLRELDDGLQKAAAIHAGKPIVASHPVYQYLARRYGLAIRSLHWEPDAHPDAKAWEAFDALLKAHPARLMLWEAEPRPETRARLRSLDIAVVVFPTLGNRPESGDFVGILRRAAEQLSTKGAER
jgi:zinc transport system substrate-binding protein